MDGLESSRNLEKNILITKILVGVIVIEIITIIITIYFNIDKEIQYSYIESSEKILQELNLLNDKIKELNTETIALSNESKELEQFISESLASFYTEALSDIKEQLQIKQQ